VHYEKKLKATRNLRLELFGTAAFPYDAVENSGGEGKTGKTFKMKQRQFYRGVLIAGLSTAVLANEATGLMVLLDGRF